MGAHPSYPDRAGFGRRPMEMAPSDLASSLADQISALVRVAASLGATVCSVKPHGALYSQVGAHGAAFDVLLGVVVDRCDPGTSWSFPPERPRSPGRRRPVSPSSKRGSPIAPTQRTVG